jgi:L-cysteine S-thiosulfotransferase
MRIPSLITVAAATALSLIGWHELSAQDADISASVERAIKASWTKATPEWQARLVQDETQRVCSQYHNAPPKDVADAVLAREKATIEYPPDGKLMGDWKKGEKLAQSGYGGRFTDYPPRQQNGGNCYSCHQLDKMEVSFGTLGPSLSEYGKIRRFTEAEVKAAYERVYNPQAVIPCGNMPRLGASKFLTIDQIKDVVAYLMSPDSPVNK